MNESNAAAQSLLDDLAEAIASRVADRLVAQLTANVQEPQSWRLLNVSEVGEMLGRSRRWVHQAVRERGLPFIRLDGGGLAFDPRDVEEWARNRRIPAVEPSETPCTRIADGMNRGIGGRNRRHNPTGTGGKVR